jgi:hypothetical protein
MPAAITLRIQLNANFGATMESATVTSSVPFRAYWAARGAPSCEHDAGVAAGCCAASWSRRLGSWLYMSCRPSWSAAAGWAVGCPICTPQSSSSARRSSRAIIVVVRGERRLPRSPEMTARSGVQSNCGAMELGLSIARQQGERDGAPMATLN